MPRLHALRSPINIHIFKHPSQSMIAPIKLTKICRVISDATSSCILTIHGWWWLHWISLVLTPVLSLNRLSPFNLHSFSTSVIPWTRPISTSLLPLMVPILRSWDDLPINKQITWNQHEWFVQAMSIWLDISTGFNFNHFDRVRRVITSVIFVWNIKIWIW